MKLVKYTNYKDIQEAINKGIRVFWKNNSAEVIKNNSRHHNIHVKMPKKDKLLVTKLRDVIKKYGYKDFYSEIESETREIKFMDIILNVEECTLEDSIKCGFKQNWIEGEDGDNLINMTSGAGCGSKWLQISIENSESEDEIKYFRVDMAKFLVDFTDKVLQKSS